MAEFDEILKKYTDLSTGGLHGASFVAVDSKGNDIYRGAHGSRTVDGSEPLTLDTLTWIASQTKLTTSVAAMQLVERGLVGLDDEVRDIVSELRDLKVLLGFEGEDAGAVTGGLAGVASGETGAETEKPKGKPIFENVKGPITLRHLLTHTSGMAYDLIDPLLIKYSAWAGRKDNMFSGKIEGSLCPLVYQPGTSWQYSVGIDWAGRLIEILTKQDLDAYLQANVWNPLGAKNTTYRPATHYGESSIPPMQETAYRGEDGMSLKAGPSMLAYPARDCIGGAGIYSTANDFGKLLCALAQGGGPILKKESVDELLRPQVGVAGRKALHELVTGPAGMTGLWGPQDADPTDVMDVGYSLCGVVNSQDVPGRRRKGTVNWGGLPNLAWWIDVEAGVAATFFTQIVPTGDARCNEAAKELEEALYRVVDGRGK